MSIGDQSCLLSLMKPHQSLPCARAFVLAAAFALISPSFARADESDARFVPLFNGDDLKGWVVRGGKAQYAVEGGAIVGTCAVKNGGNTFLCTDRDYADFVLELEIKSDHGLNSGVQIRSMAFDRATTYRHGNETIRIAPNRVHGYQVEVDHRQDRRWSGGVYEEARRLWLFPLPTNSPAGQAFKFGDWNKYRIECVGSSIRTWVNDIPAADLIDAETLRGFIGLQVHSAEKPEFQVRFRNVRLKDLGAHQWQTAWDCSSLDALEKIGSADWKVADGVLTGRQSKDQSQAGELRSQAVLSDFTIRMKYKIVNGSFQMQFRPSAKDGTVLTCAVPPNGTNFMTMGEWNTLSATVRQQGNLRWLWSINGRKVSDQTEAQSKPLNFNPSLLFPVGIASEVSFKDFEILAPVQ